MPELQKNFEALIAMLLLAGYANQKNKKPLSELKLDSFEHDTIYTVIKFNAAKASNRNLAIAISSLFKTDCDTDELHIDIDYTYRGRRIERRHFSIRNGE